MLTKIQLAEIKELQKLCEHEEGNLLKLNWDMLESRQDHENYDFFHYEEGRLIGFIGLYGFGNKFELCGMVHPDYRRKGIFTKLFNRAIEELESENISQLLLNAPAGSDSAKEFLATIPNQYYMTEYQMKWEESKITLSDDIIIRKSAAEDLNLEAQLDIQCFGYKEAEAMEFTQRLKQDPRVQFFIIEAEGKPVGKLRVDHPDREAWIYGFAVLPDYQGKGIGRKALSRIIDIEHQNGYPVFLEVEAKNAHALKLYESCGFKSYHAQDYYEYKPK